MPEKTYKEKLLDPRWQKARLVILTRDDFTCQSCGSTEKTLHIHHCGYSSEFNNPWDYPESWLKTLCFECHGDETENLKHVKSQLMDICYSFGFLTKDYDRLFDVLNEMNFKSMTPDDLVRLIRKEKTK